MPAPPPSNGPSSFRRAPAPQSAQASADGPMRLNKRMAELKICSRREADEWIANGWVKVNGKPAEMLSLIHI